MLKKKYPKLHKKSAHYSKQAPFKGSDRQIRGKILNILLDNHKKSELELQKNLKVNKNKLQTVLNQLKKEGFIIRRENKYLIKK